MMITTCEIAVLAFAVLARSVTTGAGDLSKSNPYNN